MQLWRVRGALPVNEEDFVADWRARGDSVAVVARQRGLELVVTGVGAGAQEGHQLDG